MCMDEDGTRTKRMQATRGSSDTAICMVDAVDVMVDGRRWQDFFLLHSDDMGL
jgi:hypothetical protein